MNIDKIMNFRRIYLINLEFPSSYIFFFDFNSKKALINHKGYYANTKELDSKNKFFL